MLLVWACQYAAAALLSPPHPIAAAPLRASSAAQRDSCCRLRWSALTGCTLNAPHLVLLLVYPHEVSSQAPLLQHVAASRWIVAHSRTMGVHCLLYLLYNSCSL